ncbi:MAG TPA: hypothetical protein VIC51_08665, partial [Psychromonas sp.]
SDFSRHIEMLLEPQNSHAMTLLITFSDRLANNSYVLCSLLPETSAVVPQGIWPLFCFVSRLRRKRDSFLAEALHALRISSSFSSVE